MLPAVGKNPGQSVPITGEKPGQIGHKSPGIGLRRKRAADQAHLFDNAGALHVRDREAQFLLPRRERAAGGTGGGALAAQRPTRRQTARQCQQIGIHGDLPGRRNHQGYMPLASRPPIAP